MLIRGKVLNSKLAIGSEGRLSEGCSYLGEDAYIQTRITGGGRASFGRSTYFKFGR